jgi:hypothetical protein
LGGGGRLKVVGCLLCSQTLCKNTHFMLEANR